MSTVSQPKQLACQPAISSAGKLASDSLAAGILFALIFTIGQRVIGFVRSVLFCRLMTDQELGQWSIVWGFLMLLPPLAMLGLPGCFGKYTEYFVQRGSGRTFVLRVALVSGVTTLCGLLLLLAMPQYFAHSLLGDRSSVGLMVCLIATLLAVSLSNFAASLLESIRQVRLVSFMRFLIVLLFTLLGSGSILLFERAVEAVTLAYGLSCLLSLLPALWLLHRYRGEIWKPDAKPYPQSKMWKRVLPFAGWLWVSNLLNNSIEIADRYMLLQYANVPLEVAQSYVGQYHSSRIIPTLLTSIAAMLGGILLPFLSRSWEAGLKVEAARQQNLTFKLLGLTFTIGGIVILMFSQFFFDTILQGKYSAGLAVLPMTMVLATWFSLYTVGQDYLWVAERGRYVSLSLAAGLAVNIGLNVWFIPQWGLWGAVLAATIGNLLVVTSLLALNHACGCHTDKGMWVVVALPLVFLLPPIAAAQIVSLVMLLATTTECLFSRSEKEAGLLLWEQAVQKFRR